MKGPATPLWRGISSSAASVASTGLRERSRAVRQAVSVSRPPAESLLLVPQGFSQLCAAGASDCSTDVVKQSKATVAIAVAGREGSSQVDGRNTGSGGHGPYHQLPLDPYLNSIPAPGIEANRVRLVYCGRRSLGMHTARRRVPSSSAGHLGHILGHGPPDNSGSQWFAADESTRRLTWANA
jgi:hypothetical protein